MSRLLAAGLAVGVLAGASPVIARRPVVLAFGDSLTAGFGLPAHEAFPAQLQRRLAAEGVKARIINAGVSGDTTAGGLSRIDWALADKPQLVILELGANDALRGIDPVEVRKNLTAIIAKTKASGARLLLAGMLAPPNWGPSYDRAFDSIYPDLAREYHVALYPFFLEGVAMKQDLNQPDGLHPNARGVAVIVERIAPYVVRLLDKGETG